MKRLDRNVGAFDGPLEQAPEVLHAVRVNRAINLYFCVVNGLVP